MFVRINFPSDLFVGFFFALQTKEIVSNTWPNTNKTDKKKKKTSGKMRDHMETALPTWLGQAHPRPNGFIYTHWSDIESD